MYKSVFVEWVWLSLNVILRIRTFRHACLCSIYIPYNYVILGYRADNATALLLWFHSKVVVYFLWTGNQKCERINWICQLIPSQTEEADYKRILEKTSTTWFLRFSSHACQTQLMILFYCVCCYVRLVGVIRLFLPSPRTLFLTHSCYLYAWIFRKRNLLLF